LDSLLIAPELFTADGGIARILRLYLKALCEISGEGDSVRFISLNDLGADSAILGRYSGSRLVAWETCSRNKAKFIRGAFRMGMNSDRIICGHVAQLPIAWAVSRIRRRLPYYLVAHGIEVWRRFSFLERRALLGARRVLCVSEFTRQELLRHFPLPRARTMIAPNALDPYFEAGAAVAAPTGPPIVLTVSRLSVADSYKGVYHLVEAMPTVLAAIPDARLRIVGRGDALPGLQSLAGALGVSGAVEFTGFRTDAELRSDFERCRLFALPSQREGFGLVYIEAMAHGRPCLGANCGGVPELMDEETGVLVEFGDVPAIAKAIVGALRREWPVGPLVRRAQEFSYQRFKEDLAGLLSP
jgi:glycosyltransferase involved in cell wall biosynthesis